MSTRFCSVHPSQASSASWIFAIFAKSASLSAPSKLLYWIKSSPAWSRPPATQSKTEVSPSRGSSCSRRAILSEGSIQRSPSSRPCSPVSTRKRVVLPTPFRPSNPRRSPFETVRSSLSNKTWVPKCNSAPLKRSNDIMGYSLICCEVYSRQRTAS